MRPELRQYGIHPLSQQDFADSTMHAIEIDADVQCSFGINAHLIAPDDETIHNDGSTTCVFSIPPDTIYTHRPLKGPTGNKIPVLETIQCASLTHTSIELKQTTPAPPPHGEQPQTQDDYLPIGVDTGYSKAAVAGYDTQLPQPQQLTLKCPANNTPLQHTAFHFPATRKDPNDALAWMEPAAAEAEVIMAGMPSRLCGFGGMFVADSTGSHDFVPCLGYHCGTCSGLWGTQQIAIGSGSSATVVEFGDAIDVYRSVDGRFGLSMDYCLFIDLSRISAVFNDRVERQLGSSFSIRVRHSYDLDSQGRIVWRGWSDWVTFAVNKAPDAPLELLMRY